MTMNDRHTFFRQQFDRLAPGYKHNIFTHWMGRSELAALRAMIPPPSRVGITPALDFGCGPGRAVALMLDLGYRVTGYDLSPQMLALARNTIGERPDVTFTSNPEALQDSYPLIVSLGVLDYYPDTASLWQEWRRLLSPGGVLLVTAPNARSPLARGYTVVSRFTCQAYTTTLDKLATTAGAVGFTLAEMRFAFPNRWWGHTLVLKFQLQEAP